MIDLEFPRENPEVTREFQRTRGEDPALVDWLLEADTKRHEIIASTDALCSEQKGFGKKIDQASKEERPAMLEKVKELSDAMKAAETEQRETEAKVERLQYLIGSTVTGASVGGKGDFVVLEETGEIPQFDFEPKDHLDFGESLGLIDVERGVKVSDPHFYFLAGYGTMLQLAIMNLTVQKVTQNDFQPMVPSVLVRPETMAGIGFLGTHFDEVYYLQGDDLCLVGTSEVALAGYHSNGIINLSEGPRRYAGWSSCFRRKTGSYGEDTCGIPRIYQFDKLEVSSYCPPEQVGIEYQELLNMEYEILVAVEVLYRIIDVAGGNLGAPATHKSDTEAWVPTQDTYRELASISNCTTFQVRRLKTHYRDADGKSQCCTTLNGTLTTMRRLIVTLENHQQADGSVAISEALCLFMAGKEVLEPVKRVGQADAALPQFTHDFTTPISSHATPTVDTR